MKYIGATSFNLTRLRSRMAAEESTDVYSFRRARNSTLLVCIIACQNPGMTLLVADHGPGDTTTVEKPEIPRDCNVTVGPDGDAPTIQEAADAAIPGDVICVPAGQYDERVRVRRSGTSDAEIVLTADGAVLTRGFVLSADYVTIEGFEIVSPTPVSAYDYAARRDGSGIHVEGSHCRLLDNVIHDVPLSGINFYSTDRDDPGVSNCEVRDNTIYRAGLVGIYVAGRNHLVEGNDISHTLQYPEHLLNPTSGADADGMRFFGRGHVIRDNYIHDITFADPEVRSAHIDCFQTWGPASQITFEGNTCTLPDPQPYDSCQLTMIEVWVAPVSDLTFTRNVFVTNSAGYCPINIKGSEGTPIRNTTIAHNVFYRSDGRGQYAVRLLETEHTVIQNNIFYDYFSTRPYLYCEEGDCDEVNTAIVVGHNLVYASDGVPPPQVAATDVWQADPGFLDPASLDFRVGSDSPACGAGTDGADIGAFPCPPSS